MARSGVDGAARAGETILDNPVSVYEVHLGSWRKDENGQPLTYRELATRLVEYVKENGLHAHRVDADCGAPVFAILGLSGDGIFRPDLPLRSPEDFMYFIDAAIRRASASSSIGFRAHFPKDAHGLAFFDGTALYEHEDPRLGEHRDWGTLIFNFGRNEVRSFLISNAMFWLKKYHIDGLRVDAVASMLYLDYSRKAGRVGSQMYGGNENLEAIEFLKKSERAGASGAGRDHRCRRIDRVHGRVAPGVSERARLHNEVEHGLDARHAALLREGSHLPQISPERHHVQHGVCVHGEFRPADLARRGGVWQTGVARQDAGR